MADPLVREPATSLEVTTRVNGVEHTRTVEARLLLSDFLRHELGLTGTHVGCEHGVCGACTVLLDDQPVRSCLILAAQVDGRELTTVEGLSPGPEALHPLQEAFWDAHALQCGFCTPGILLTSVAFLRTTRSRRGSGAAGALRQPRRCAGFRHRRRGADGGAARSGVAAGGRASLPRRLLRRRAETPRQ